MGKGGMSPKRLFNLLIALTVAAGLLSAPVAKAHHAGGGMDAGMHAMSGDDHAMASDMHAMANMPCCPDEGTNGCDSCPLMALCSMTTMIGYSSLLLSRNRALRSFGLLADLGEIACLMAALVVLPAIVRAFHRRDDLR